MDLQMMLVKTMIRFFGPRLFDKGYRDTQKSKLYPQFCERVFGRNLSQFNMLPEEQLQWLLKAVAPLPGSEALDIGCGIGLITKFLSENTKFHWTGFDYAPDSIKAAQSRVQTVSDKIIDFVVADLINLSEMKSKIQSFDLLVSIDSLYFVKNLEATIHNLRQLLKPGGTFVCFFVAKASHSSEREILEPSKTKLAIILKKLNMNFVITDFTDMDFEFWKHSLIVAEEMLPAFEEEGSAHIAKGRIFESKKNLKWHSQGLIRRYGYLIRN